MRACVYVCVCLCIYVCLGSGPATAFLKQSGIHMDSKGFIPVNKVQSVYSTHTVRICKSLSMMHDKTDAHIYSANTSNNLLKYVYTVSLLRFKLACAHKTVNLHSSFNPFRPCKPTWTGSSPEVTW